jgi:hypothetical protein
MEAREQIARVGEIGEQALDGDALAEEEVLRHGDHTHAARAEHALDAVAPGDHVARFERRLHAGIVGRRALRGKLRRAPAPRDHAGLRSDDRVERGDHVVRAVDAVGWIDLEVLARHS